MKKSIPILFAVPVILSLSASTSFAANYSDTSNHWAEIQINKWSDYGVINGSEGLFRPNDSITRGEMAVIIDKIMGYKVKSENVFNDLGQAFYTDSILKAYHADVMKGSDGKVRPTDNITREEAAILICKAFGMKPSSESSINFSDKESISSWALEYVNSLATKGYITGRGGNNFEPKGNITRSEAVTIMDNIVKDLYNIPGEYSKDVTGTVVVNTPDAKLKDMTISGDLIIAEGVANGNVTLENVNVLGTTLVKGGGENSIHILGSSKMPNIDVSKIDGSVRVAVSDTSKVESVNIKNGSNNVTLMGKINSVKLNSSSNTVSAVDANISNVVLNNLGAGFILDKNSTSDTITVSSSANNSRLDIRGNANKINVGALQTRLVSDKNSNIQNIEVTQTAISSNLQLSGKTNTISISSQNTELTANENSKIDNISVFETANSTSLNVKGEATNIKIKAPKSEISVSGTVDTVEVSETAKGLKAIAQRDGKITTIDSKASQTDISGTGKVANVKISGNDSNINTKNTSIKVDSGVKGTTSGNTYISGGATTSSGSSSGSSGGYNDYYYYQKAPTGLWTTHTSSSNNDGKIMGTTTEMEYRISSSDYYSSCSQGETRGLRSGTYYVRYKARNGYSAGEIATVVIQYNNYDYTSPKITESSVTFNKNSYNQSDISLKINWGEGAYKATNITSVRVDGVSISSYDYTISNDYLIIDKDALQYLSLGDKYINVTFNDILNTTRTVTLNVIDTATEYYTNILSSDFISNDNITVSDNVYGKCYSASMYNNNSRNITFNISSTNNVNIDNSKIKFRTENGFGFINGFASVPNSVSYPSVNVDTTESIPVFYESKKIGELRIRYKLYSRY